MSDMKHHAVGIMVILLASISVCIADEVVAWKLVRDASGKGSDDRMTLIFTDYLNNRLNPTSVITKIDKLRFDDQDGKDSMHPVFEQFLKMMVFAPSTPSDIISTMQVTFGKMMDDTSPDDWSMFCVVFSGNRTKRFIVRLANKDGILRDR